MGKLKHPDIIKKQKLKEQAKGIMTLKVECAKMFIDKCLSELTSDSSWYYSNLTIFTKLHMQQSIKPIVRFNNKTDNELSIKPQQIHHLHLQNNMKNNE